MSLIKNTIFCLASFTILIAGCTPRTNIDTTSPENLSNSRPQLTQQTRPIKLTKNSPCKPGIGWEKIIMHKPEGFYFFGEWHGTNEMAPLTVEFACALADYSQKPTLVLFETDASDVFAKARSTHREDLRALLLTEMKNFWFNESQDGRRTEPMMEAMLRIKDLMDLGLPIEFGSLGPTSEQFLSVDKYVTGGTIKNFEFENILKSSHNYANIITLTGNFHTYYYAHKMQQSNRTDWVAFDQVYENGIGRNCMSTCGVNSFGTHKFAETLNQYEDKSYIFKPELHDKFDAFVMTRTTTAADFIKERGD